MARSRLSEVDYRLDTFTDTASGRRYAEVADAAVTAGSAARGWGRIYVDLAGPPHWSVQVPHPHADRYTERLGAEVLRGAPGGVMVLAGAHRKAASGGGGEGGVGEAGGDGDAEREGRQRPEDDPADMAHRTDSVFHAVVAELTRRGLPGIQLHGFADSSVPDTGAVVSTGAGDRAAAEAAGLAAALEGEGVTVCRARDTSCPLAGRTNAQGRLAAEHGTRFLHLELSRSLRAHPDPRAGAARAIACVTEGWAGRA
ncbi:hypothetical protein [Streptomyces sp. NPDC048606]|uniref:hypothetical protein n=1 Tax=Streptomyces sp. NPDC048606 TaxID=3154726 RepID=UPI00343A76EC